MTVQMDYYDVIRTFHSNHKMLWCQNVPLQLQDAMVTDIVNRLYVCVLCVCVCVKFQKYSN